MKLAKWLDVNGISRVEFARRIGLSPAAVTQLCNNRAGWLSRETAETILRETRGAVTPNDFLGTPGGLRESYLQESLMTQSVKETIEAFKRGEIVIVTDDDDRENEGDLICAASLCTTEMMAFIIRHTCGIVCAPVSVAEAKRLRLEPMVASNDAPLGTAFTVTVDVRHGLTTGISAEQRANTVRGLANPNMGPGDFVRPGHIFPLIARDGGVLMRSGHTEAAVDLCILAGLPPVGTICELANDDGTVMKGAQIEAFAREHGLKRISVADLIAYRQARERLVERVGSFPVQADIGELTGYIYVTPFDDVQHFAFVYGDTSDGENVPARLHRADVIGDIFGGKSLHQALDYFKQQGRGILVYLRDGAAGVPVKRADESEGTEAARVRQWHEVGLGAQILRDLGVTSIDNITTAEREYIGLSGFGISISRTTALGK